MFGKYVQVLRRPGAVRFTAAGMLARLQMSMAGIGAVMLLSAERDSFAIAGAVTAIYALSAAVIGPPISRLIDSFGQSRVVPLQLAVHVPAIAAIIARRAAHHGDLADLLPGVRRRRCAAERRAAGPGALVGAVARLAAAAHRVRVGVAGRRGRVHPRPAARDHRRAADHVERRR